MFATFNFSPITRNPQLSPRNTRPASVKEADAAILLKTSVPSSSKVPSPSDAKEASFAGAGRGLPLALQAATILNV